MNDHAFVPSTKKHAFLIQFDIESLSLHPTNAVVGEVGISVMHIVNDNGELSETHRSRSIKLNMQEQADKYGRQVDIDTVQWWLKQGEAPRKAMADIFMRLSLGDGIHAIEAFIRPFLQEALSYGVEAFILSSAPAFDMTNIHSLYHHIGGSAPWAHWQEHSQRTLRWLAPVEAHPTRTVGNEAHRGEDDAAWQNNVLYHLMQADTYYGRALRGFFKLE
jgi:hypothetical protein